MARLPSAQLTPGLVYNKQTDSHKAICRGRLWSPVYNITNSSRAYKPYAQRLCRARSAEVPGAYVLPVQLQSLCRAWSAAFVADFHQGSQLQGLCQTRSAGRGDHLRPAFSESVAKSLPSKVGCCYCKEVHCLLAASSQVRPEQLQSLCRARSAVGDAVLARYLRFGHRSCKVFAEQGRLGEMQYIISQLQSLCRARSAGGDAVLDWYLRFGHRSCKVFAEQGRLGEMQYVIGVILGSDSTVARSLPGRCPSSGSSQVRSFQLQSLCRARSAGEAQFLVLDLHSHSCEVFAEHGRLLHWQLRSVGRARSAEVTFLAAFRARTWSRALGHF